MEKENFIILIVLMDYSARGLRGLCEKSRKNKVRKRGGRKREEGNPRKLIKFELKIKKKNFFPFFPPFFFVFYITIRDLVYFHHLNYY